MSATLRSLATVLACSAFAFGCLSDAPSDPDDESQVDQALGDTFVFTTYYADREMTEPAGMCITASRCTSDRTVCTGHKTGFPDVQFRTCP